MSQSRLDLYVGTDLVMRVEVTDELSRATALQSIAALTADALRAVRDRYAKERGAWEANASGFLACGGYRVLRNPYPPPGPPPSFQVPLVAVVDGPCEPTEIAAHADHGESDL